jgi:putative transposase
MRLTPRRGKPAIFNTGQGSQFTSLPFTNALKEAGVLISMDGRGSYQDNIFTERLWRSVKYEEVYLKDYTTLDQAKTALEAYFAFYNQTRPHQELAYQTPAQVHFALAAKPTVDIVDTRQVVHLMFRWACYRLAKV